MVDLLWAALWYLQVGQDQAPAYVPPLSDTSHITIEIGPTVIITVVGLAVWMIKTRWGGKGGD